MHRYLAVSELPAKDTRANVEAMLSNLARVAHQFGMRPIETFYSLQRGRCYTLFDAESAAIVETAHAAAGLSTLEVVPGDRIHTELLDAPRRSR